MTLTEFVILCGQAEKLYDTTCSCDGCPLEKCEAVIEFNCYPCGLPRLLRRYGVEVPELCAVDLPGSSGGAGSADTTGGQMSEKLMSPEEIKSWIDRLDSGQITQVHWPVISTKELRRILATVDLYMEVLDHCGQVIYQAIDAQNTTITADKRQA